MATVRKESAHRGGSLGTEAAMTAGVAAMTRALG